MERCGHCDTRGHGAQSPSGWHGRNGRTVWTVASLCVENHVDGAGIMLAKCAPQTSNIDTLYTCTYCFTLSTSRKSVDLHFEHLALDTLI